MVIRFAQNECYNLQWPAQEAEKIAVIVPLNLNLWELKALN